MIAKDLISYNVPPLKTTDTGEKALQWMSDFYVRHLPVIEGDKFVGLVGEDDILDVSNPELPIHAHNLSLHRPVVKSQEHIYETIKIFVNLQLSILPVIDEEDTYLGVITAESLLTYFAQSASLQQSGAILIVEVGVRDYAMSEVARIVESEGASILSSFVTSSHDSTKIEITLKINRQNLSGIIGTFKRYGYTVSASFLEQEYSQNLKERYDAFISYLNV
jgi:acetoin utilization protein AcuB